MTKHQNPVSCDFDSNSITVAQAMAHIRETIVPITDQETIDVYSALGRVTAKDIVSAFNVPNHTNSAMDGYAVNGNALPKVNSKGFELVGASFAGAPYHGSVGPDQCVRIMTGGVMPEGADTVVVQERVAHVEGRVDGRVVIPAGDKIGANVRYAGEDLKVGDIAIPEGIKLGASQMGLAASLGMKEITVFRRPKIAYFSNGDELRSVGNPLEIGEVYDSNRYTLHAMLSELGVQQFDLGIIKDDLDAIANAFKAAAEDADMIITTAGASVGDADYVKQALAGLGEVSFWKVAIKPGRPMSFGKLNNSLFFGLPGNPVSVMVTFQIFVKAAIKRLSGEKFSVPLVLKVKTLSDLKKRPGRMEYQRGVLSLDENGETVVSSTGQQGSGILSSMSLANCYIILSDESQGAKAGDWVEVQPIDQNC
ncbi:gephyrin-like molybdotransferase Glp [Candidatus Spongiihabitans sp.]|uniref:molybdopterin molybdotransferase MoeA n=1 Tax=Candidatus Spongiihabitans sp. TaxID=3101308 RepID=UPI003C6FF33A